MGQYDYWKPGWTAPVQQPNSGSVSMPAVNPTTGNSIFDRARNRQVANDQIAQGAANAATQLPVGTVVGTDTMAAIPSVQPPAIAPSNFAPIQQYGLGGVAQGYNPATGSFGPGPAPIEYGKNGVAQGYNPATGEVGSQMPAATNYNTGIFANTSNGIAQGVNQTLEDSLTGKIMDPTASRLRQSQARQEATTRAATANRLAGAGFSGTGIAQQVGSGVENDLAQNRFNTEIGIAEATNNARMGAVGQGIQFGQAQQGAATDALSQAALYGSDADVVAAYKQTYGKDLDPASVSQYRGYARTAAENANTLTGQQAKSGTAAAFAAYTTANPNSTVENDPALVRYAQSEWEATGGKGTVPTSWAAARVAAVRDPKLTNSIVATNASIDEAVTEGALSAEDAAVMKKLNSTGIFGQYSKVDASGNVTIDWAKMREDMGSGSTNTTSTIPAGKNPGDTYSLEGKTYTVNADGKTSTETTITPPAGKVNGEYWTAKDGNLYKMEGGEAVKTSIEEVPLSKVTAGTDGKQRSTWVSGKSYKIDMPDGTQQILKSTGKVNGYDTFLDQSGKTVSMTTMGTKDNRVAVWWTGTGIVDSKNSLGSVDIGG